MTLEHSYWLFLVVLVPLFFILRKPKYYVKISSIVYSGVKSKFNYGKAFNYIACASLFCAAVGICFSGYYTEYASPKRSYTLINDGSMSMVFGSLVEPLMDANEKFLDLLKEKKREDLVGFVVFSDNAFVVSYLIDDTDFIVEKMNDINWEKPPLAGGTQVEKALWTGVKVAFKNTGLLDADLEIMHKGCLGAGVTADISKLKNKVSSISEMARGNCLVLFTDGYFNPTAMNRSDLSAVKVVDLCKNFGITVYIIDLMPISGIMGSSGFLKAVKDTGGDFLVVKPKNLAEAYKKIFEIESAYKNTKVWHKKSFSQHFALLALVMICAAFLVNKNITSV